MYEIYIEFQGLTRNVLSSRMKESSREIIFKILNVEQIFEIFKEEKKTPPILYIHFAKNY